MQVYIVAVYRYPKLRSAVQRFERGNRRDIGNIQNLPAVVLRVADRTVLKIEHNAVL